MTDKVTIPALLQMKRDGRKSVGVVAWDYQIARIADRAGVDIVSVGDSVGVNLWGHSNPLEVTMDEMLVVCKAVRRGVTRALVSCDVPFGPVQDSPAAAVRAAQRLVKEGGADLVKLGGGTPHIVGAAALHEQRPSPPSARAASIAAITRCPRSPGADSSAVSAAYTTSLPVSTLPWIA